MITRKILATGIAALALSSCSTITHTSQTAAVDTQVYNLTVADMKVASKKDSVTVDWKWNPLSTVSLKAQKESATHTLLGKSDADVLVEPQYIVNRRGIFRGGSVTVTGYPATYSDFRPMTADDAEKIATVNGDYNTVIVNPVISTTAGKVVKPARRPASPIMRSRRAMNNYQFVNVLGGVVFDIDDQVEAGYQFGAMYGKVGQNWGWYGKFTLSTAMCWRETYGYHHESNEERKWTPSVTVGGIKTFGHGFSGFAGVGLGGYFVNEYDNYIDKDVTKFSIPVEIGFMKRFHRVNVMLGATYATPLSSGSGNADIFLGLGYAF
ncbi:MAG: hypothetical protein HDS69_01460 [Bacteroidales bacterium]|nr:hypothetical protein [Bacteroidales bacterium]